MMAKYGLTNPLRRARWRALLTCLVFLAAVPVLAQSGGSYDLSWSTVDGGGGTVLAGGAYRVTGTGGQPDAGLVAGGAYALGGGFWGGGAVLPDGHGVFLPLVLRGY